MRRSILGGLAVSLCAVTLIGCGSIGNELYSVTPAAISSPARSVWSSYRGDARNTGQGMGSGATNLLLWSTAAGLADRVEASPVLGADGTVYIGADDGKFYAFNGATGAIRWVVTVQTEGVDSTATVGADRTVYVGAGKSVVALDPASGGEKWRFATGGDVESSPTIGPDGTLNVGADDGKLYALEASSGAFKWYFAFTDGSDTDSSPALGAEGSVYIGTGGGTLHALDGRSGNLRWSFTAAGEITGAPAVDAGGSFQQSTRQRPKPSRTRLTA